MKKVERQDIVDYQTYEEQRNALREKVFAEKDLRRLHLGPNLTFLFETTETIRYQIQEMMRAERMVKEADIQHEISTYNDLLGDSGELGCTLLIEITDPKERDQKLRAWLRLPAHLFIECEDGKRCPCIYDDRQIGEDRLSSVQYMKFNIGTGRPQALVCDHPLYTHRLELTEEQKNILASDSH